MMLSDCREGSYLYVNKQTGTKENYIVVCNNCHMLFDEKKSIAWLYRSCTDLKDFRGKRKTTRYVIQTHL